MNHERKQNSQARSRPQNSDGLADGAQLGTDDAGGMEGFNTAGTERMDLLGHLGETRSNAQSPNPTRGRGSSGGQAPTLLLARLSASTTQREEMVQVTTCQRWSGRSRFARALKDPTPAKLVSDSSCWGVSLTEVRPLGGYIASTTKVGRTEYILSSRSIESSRVDC
jgi:hypothetical protein